MGKRHLEENETGYARSDLFLHVLKLGELMKALVTLFLLSNFLSLKISINVKV